MELKTYWHLAGERRIPSDYEVATSRLLYYPGRGFEVNTPLQRWYQTFQQGSAFRCSDWEKFQDPRQTTYASYTELQASKEAYVDGLLESIDASDYDKKLSPVWIRILEKILPPLRYPCHGLQMASAYVAHMAPSGRIVAAGLFQAADEMRRVQRLAYRMRQIQAACPDFGRDSRSLWEKDPLWQPLREVLEKLLATYDWGEAFAGLNLALKPLVDEFFMVHIGRLAQEQGDPVLGQIFLSLNEDGQWHRRWAQALALTAIQDTPANGAVLQEWVEKWRAPALKAVKSFAPLFKSAGSTGFEDALLQSAAAFGEHGTLAGL
jgi:toluene monooxygenase system protein E